jgi:hypothetical protein
MPLRESIRRAEACSSASGRATLDVIGQRTETREGGAVSVDSRPQPSIKIDGDVKGANVVIGGTQTVHGDLTITVGPMPAASEDVQQALQAQISQLLELLAAVPAEHGDLVRQMKLATEDAVAEAEKEHPDSDRLRIRADWLRKAGETFINVAPLVTKVAAQVADIVTKLV